MTEREQRPSPLQLYAPPKRYEAWRYFLRAYKNVISKIEADLEAVDIESAAQYEMMSRIYLSPGGRAQFVELSKSLFLSQSRVTRLIKRLEKEGLVLLEKSVADGHWAMFASLSPAGRKMLETAVPVLLSGFDRYFSEQLEERDLDSLIRALRALADEP